MTAVANTGAMRQTGQGISGPPYKMRQNETPYWQDTPFTDKFDTEYDSNTYTLTYYFAGAATTVQNLVGVPQTVLGNGQGWQTQFDATTSGKMVPGKYWWQAVLTFAGPPAQRIVAAEGELVVEADLANAGGGFDGRSVMEIGLANCETALTTFQSSGGMIKSYRIANREMVFQDLKEIIDLANWFRGRVEAEKQSADGGNRRMLRVGFSPPTSGVPTDSSKNWPWW